MVKKNGHLCGFILRKTLCNIIKLKAFSSPIPDDGRKDDGKGDGGVGTRVNIATNTGQPATLQVIKMKKEKKK